jgi:hypothetical protein
MRKKIVRWTMSVLGIILVIISLIVFPDDWITGVMLAFSGVLSILIGLDVIGE